MASIDFPPRDSDSPPTKRLRVLQLTEAADTDTLIEPFALVPRTFSFMGLPAELRSKIYELVLPTNNVVFVYFGRLYRYTGSREYRLRNSTLVATRNLKAVFLVCRRIYEEASYLFYSSNTFEFLDHWNINRFRLAVGNRNAVLVRQISIGSGGFGLGFSSKSSVEVAAQYMVGVKEITIRKWKRGCRDPMQSRGPDQFGRTEIRFMKMMREIWGQHGLTHVTYNSRDHTVRFRTQDMPMDEKKEVTIDIDQEWRDYQAPITKKRNATRAAKALVAAAMAAAAAASAIATAADPSNAP